MAENRTYRGLTYIANKKRSDQRVSASLGVTLRALAVKGFAPRPEYTYTHNNSNIDLYDFPENTFTLSLTKQF